MKPIISCASIDTGIVANEHRFLKFNPDSNAPAVQTPKSFVSDLLLREHAFREAFAQKLTKASEFEKKPFLCAVIRLLPPPVPAKRGSISPAETRLGELLSDKEGFWGRIKDDVYVMVLWNHPPKTKENRLLRLQDKLEKALDLKVSLGMSNYPHKINCTPKETFHNAIMALDHASFFDPGTAIIFDEVSLNIWGDRLYQLGRITDAIHQYKKGLELAPSNINLINSLGVCHGIMNRFDLAMQQFQKVMAMEPCEVMARYNMGLACYLLGDLKTGLAHIQQASSMNSTFFEVELTLGNLFLENNKFEKAQTHLERSKELKPDSHLPYRFLGDFFLTNNRPEKAVPIFSKAIRLNSSDGVSLSGLARAYELQEINMEIALTFAEQSVALDPENHLFLERLGRIYKRQGLHQEAGEAFERAGLDFMTGTIKKPEFDKKQKLSA